MIGREIDIETTQVCTVGDVRSKLQDAYPHAVSALEDRRVRAVVGDEFVGEDRVVAASDTVEFLPPVSGG